MRRRDFIRLLGGAAVDVCIDACNSWRGVVGLDRSTSPSGRSPPSPRGGDRSGSW